ncbi:MAG: LamG-like jellyroll fold domain-containing protein [Chitinophagaceae bacterium]
MKLSSVLSYGCLFLLSSGFASAQNNSLNFDGVDDYIRVPYSPTHYMTDAVTIEAWVYPTNNNWGNILIKGNYGYGFALSGEYGLGACGSSNNLVFWDQSQCGSTIRSTLTYVLNTWQHVAVTVQAVGPWLEIFFYLDGVMNGPYYTSQSIDNGNIDNAIYIGTQGFGLGNFFTGNMEELRLWNIARTPGEILATMNSQMNPVGQTNLIMYYSFNQGVAQGDNSTVTIATDGTANSNNGTLNNFTLNGSISNWVGLSPAVLPVRLISFSAIRNAGGIELKWSTAQEDNSRSFEIQRSENNNFIRIGSIAAAGNSDNRIDYQFTDVAPAGGNNYYRLKQIDIDGRFEYSRIVKVNFEFANYLKLQGNPVQTHLKTVFTSEGNGRIKIIISNASGAIVVERTIAVQKGNNEITIPLNGINSGTYYMQAISGSWKQVLKFSKL